MNGGFYLLIPSPQYIPAAMCSATNTPLVPPTMKKTKKINNKTTGDATPSGTGKKKNARKNSIHECDPPQRMLVMVYKYDTQTRGLFF